MKLLLAARGVLIDVHLAVDAISAHVGRLVIMPLKKRLAAAAALAPALVLSAAGAALAVDPDSVSPSESGSCTSVATYNGHGYANCQYTYSYFGFATGSSYADATATATANVSAKANAQTAGHSAVGFINDHLDGGAPEGAKGGPCNRYIVSSSVYSWDYRTSPSSAASHSWDPVADADKPYGAWKTETWRVSCTVSW
ncbi:hypothetical protein ACF08N_36480 [Streptomyces sp. NPDC015127]|uniref:hypothetical protein n=1 Tax=Streptomyces sp. NPDC015127 TaxID=3364939 RepID=UPI0036F9D465